MQILKDIRKKQIIKNSNILESLLDRFSPKKQYVNIADSNIPLPENCWCGPEFKDNECYIKSAENESKY